MDDRKPNSKSIILWLALIATVIIGGFFYALFVLDVPGFFEFVERAKVDRAKSNMRFYAVALTSYQIENKAYPVWAIGSDSITGNNEIPSFAVSMNGMEIGSITTPICYATNYVVDPFNPGQVTTYAYYSTDFGFVIWSMGPDRDFDMDVKAVQQAFARPLVNDEWQIIKTSQEYQKLISYMFDPTNGTSSNGDIIHYEW